MEIQFSELSVHGFRELRMLFMIKWLAVLLLASTGALLCSASYANHGVSDSCMMAYEEGGVPSILNSLECPWLFSSLQSSNSTKNCQFAMLQGRREYQEDRVVCDLDLKLPFRGDHGFFYAGEGGPMEATSIGIAAIFDGHGGDEASEMASAKLSSYFLMNAVFSAYKRVLPTNEEYNKSHCSPRRKPAAIDRHSLRPILEEALLKTIQDIDTEFSKVALARRYVSGSTATIALLFEGHFLIANVGDSKALLCSKKAISPHGNQGVHVEELTRDHHPDREDEKARIEAAGGFIARYGVPRVNGILALSRAIGDIYLKRYGVTAEAEISGWRALSDENSYLVLASDGVFETLTPKDVCYLLHNKASESMASLPESIIHSAFETGSTDNLSAIVISDLNSGIEGSESQTV